MSNALVGEVYQRIIEDVILTSNIDFEEAGVNASTLQELKQVWQSKLSDLRVARFPWDPPSPEAAAQAPNSSATDGTPIKTQNNAQQQATIKQEQNPQFPSPQPQTHQVRIKQEPGLEPQGIYAPVGNPTYNPSLAEQRARQNVAQKFGPRPSGGGLVLPLANSTPQQRQNGQQNGIPQHDGADGEDTDGVSIEGYGNISRDEADRILLRRIGAAERESIKATEELVKALEALKTTSPPQQRVFGEKKRRRRVRRDAYQDALDHSVSYPLASSSSAPTTLIGQALPSINQFDGESGGEEVDEDAINSDLDDPDDDEIDNEDEDEVPQIMLCMYDKVQRTKNKWKCVLKDGVLTINGKEYVFHKATGEYEW